MKLNAFRNSPRPDSIGRQSSRFESSRWPAQNSSLAPTCPCRGIWVLVDVPNVDPLEASAFTPVRFTRFRTLKKSILKSSLTRSVMLVTFLKVASTCAKPGLRN